LLQVPLIAEVRELGLRVIVSDASHTCACRQLADVFVHADIFDIDAHLREAQAILEGGERIDGVLAAGIDAPETMAVLARQLGLPGVDPAVARLVHHKPTFRSKLRELGYPTPKFAAVTQQEFKLLDEIIASIGYPLIVKNSDSSGSRGTKIFRAPDSHGIREVVDEAIRVSRSGVALIEECWEGPEQTVETIFDSSGAFHPCFITDRHFDRSSGYPIEIGLQNPSTLPHTIQAEMFQLAERVSRDLGIVIGAAKFDMMLTKDGPRIIEMTVRLSGGFDSQYLVPAASGQNVLRAAILTALGKPLPPALLANTKRRVGLSESLWPEPGRITRIDGVAEALTLPGVEHVFFRYAEGDVVQAYSDCTKRVCFLIVSGADERSARESMAAAKRAITISTAQA
jgi:biotin carboxylase